MVVFVYPYMEECIVRITSSQLIATTLAAVTFIDGVGRGNCTCCPFQAVFFNVKVASGNLQLPLDHAFAGLMQACLHITDRHIRVRCNFQRSFVCKYELITSKGRGTSSATAAAAQSLYFHNLKQLPATR